MFKHILSTTLVIVASMSYYSFAHDISKLESLHGISFSENAIEIKVKSTGCTKAQDFRIDAVKNSLEYELRIYRIKKDRCRAMTRIVSINLELELQEDFSFRVANPFGK